MRIGIITIGSRGDVQPYIAVGKGFKRAGYEVRLLTHGAFADAAREEGVDFAEHWDSTRAQTRHPGICCQCAAHHAHQGVSKRPLPSGSSLVGSGAVSLQPLVGRDGGAGALATVSRIHGQSRPSRPGHTTALASGSDATGADPELLRV